jgi:hypothetical protein
MPLPKPKTARSNPALRLAALRQLHIWVSLFVAPSLIFFALTGALQTFRIPDQEAAPVVIQKLARLHKDDVFATKPVRPKRPDAPGQHAPKPDGPPSEAPQAKTEILKWFFSMVSIAIAATTLIGVWMALAYGRWKASNWALLVAGTLAPALMVAL